MEDYPAIGTGSRKEEGMCIVEGRQEDVERALPEAKLKLSHIKITSRSIRLHSGKTKENNMHSHATSVPYSLPYPVGQWSSTGGDDVGD